MSCCAACSQGRPCDRDNAGARIALFGDAPVLLPGTPNPDISELLDTSETISPSEMGPYMAVANAVVGVPSSVAILTGPEAIKWAAGKDSVNMAPSLLSLLSMWRVDNPTKDGFVERKDQSAEAYLEWLRSSYKADSPVAKSVVSYLEALSLSAGNPGWLEEKIKQVKGTKIGVPYIPVKPSGKDNPVATGEEKVPVKTSYRKGARVTGYQTLENGIYILGKKKMSGNPLQDPSPFRVYSKATVPNAWNSEGRGRSSKVIGAFDFAEDVSGFTLSIAVEENSPQGPGGTFGYPYTTVWGILVLEISYTTRAGIDIECDIPRSGSIWLPGNRLSLNARVDAPRANAFATPSEPSGFGEITVTAEANACRNGGDGTLRKTLVLPEPDGLLTVFAYVPKAARRFQYICSETITTFGTPGVSNVGYIVGLDVFGFQIARWETQQFYNIMNIGHMGVEIPPGVVTIGLVGLGGVASPFITNNLVFQLGVLQ